MPGTRSPSLSAPGAGGNGYHAQFTGEETEAHRERKGPEVIQPERENLLPHLPDLKTSRVKETVCSAEHRTPQR